MSDEIGELLVVLGHTNAPDGTLSKDAISRARVATRYIQARDDRKEKLVVVTTGGFGHYFNESDVPHGRLLADRIRRDGIGRAALLEHVHSCGTLQDALGVLRRVRELESGSGHTIPAITVVSSRYHMERVRFLFPRLFPTKSLAFIRDDRKGTPDQIDHEREALARLEKKIPAFGWLAPDLKNGTAGLGEEIRHYDSLSYLALAASLSLVVIWPTSFARVGSVVELVASFLPAAGVSLLLFGMYWRLAGTAGSARRTLGHVSFLTGQPHLGSSRNLEEKRTLRITTSAFAAWIIAWVSVLISISLAMPDRNVAAHASSTAAERAARAGSSAADRTSAGDRLDESRDTETGREVSAGGDVDEVQGGDSGERTPRDESIHMAPLRGGHADAQDGV